MIVRAAAATKPFSVDARKLNMPVVALLIHTAAEAMTKNTVRCKQTDRRRTIY